MRIACYGLVEEDAGSVASANFLVLKELLQQGHTIDFYAKSDFVQPDGFSDAASFQYRGVLLEGSVARRNLISPAWGGTINRLAEEWLYGKHLDAIAERVAAAHRREPYDVLLFLGVEPQFEAPPTLPVVSWVQGPPQTEWEVLARLKEQVVAVSGRVLYWKLKAFYAYKQRYLRNCLGRADQLICGSDWSRRQIERFGVSVNRTHVLPYPIDLDLFVPDADVEPLHTDRQTFLWLGRIDPRKRLDLMLEAFRGLLQERRDVHLEIVGRLSYAPEYKTLIEDFPHPEHLTYRDHVDRGVVPALLNAADVLVQPSEDENFGSSVAEALACGTPVVVGPTNGTGEFCGDAAIRFGAYTAEAIRGALTESLQVLHDDEAGIARTARREAERQFEIGNIVGRLEKMLRACTRSANPDQAKRGTSHALASQPL